MGIKRAACWKPLCQETLGQLHSALAPEAVELPRVDALRHQVQQDMVERVMLRAQLPCHPAIRHHSNSKLKLSTQPPEIYEV